VALVRGLNVRGHNIVSMSELLDRLGKTSLKEVKWIDTVGASGNLLFSNPTGIPESDIAASIKTAVKQPATIRTLEQLEFSLQALDQTLTRMAKKVERSNSNVEVLTDGNVKAGICFIICGTQLPSGVEYPKTLTRTVRAVGAIRRDVHFLWKRTNGAFGVPNKAIEDWLGATTTSRAYSIVYDIISKLQHYGGM
jgi:hypothetical protein